MAKGNGGALWLMRSYNFVNGKDPEIDVFRTLYQKQHIKETDLAVLAGLSVSTVKNMFGGKTRRPHHSTFGKMATAMGKKYALMDDRKPDYENEIPIARQERREYYAMLRKKKERAEQRKSK